MAERPVHALLARFETLEALDAAAEHMLGEGYRVVEAFAPVPIPALEHRLGLSERRIPAIALGAAVAGAALTYAFQYWSAVVAYPFAIGGKPMHAWPPFVVVAVAMALLSAVVATIVAMLVLDGFPKPYHPLFNAPGFARASRDGFFLAIGVEDPRFDPTGTRMLLERLDAASVEEAPA